MDGMDYAALASDVTFSLEAEQSVLGAVLIDPPCLARLMELLKAECFFRREHQEIFLCMVRLFTAGLPVDFVTILDDVVSEQVFDSADTAKLYLANLAKFVPSAANIEAYAEIVLEKFYVRSLIMAARDIIESSEKSGEDPRYLLDMAEQRIYDIRQGRETKGLRRIDEVVLEAYDRLQKLSGENKADFLGISTGFSGIDNVITGLNKSDLILLAARPGMGKTSFVLNLAENVAIKSGKKVAIFSLEMSNEQLVNRMLSSQSYINSYSLRTGILTPDDWVRLAGAADILSKSPVYFDDSSGITVSEMKAKLRRVKNLGVVIIDYLQLMTSDRKTENRVVEISDITRNLKIMAKELNIPVILCSQLSRGPDSRPDHRPVLSDLRESGAIEQDADIVMFLYRDSYYNRESEEQNIAECIVSKNRHGETDIVKLNWDGPHTKFTSLELNRHEP